MAILITSPLLSIEEKLFEIYRQIRCAAFKEFHEVPFSRTKVNEENKKASYRRVSSDTDLVSKGRFDKFEIAPDSIDWNDKKSKGGRGEKFHGLKGGSKIETDLPNEFSLPNDKNHSKRGATENSESSTKNGMKPIPNKLRSRGEILDVLDSILFQGLPYSEEDVNTEQQTTALKHPDRRCKTQNENYAENIETQQFDKNTESKRECLLKKITLLEREAKHSLNNSRIEVSKLKKEVENLKVTNEYLEKELKETLIQFGSLSVEYTKMVNENERINGEALYSQGPSSETSSSETSSSGTSSSGTSSSGTSSSGTSSSETSSSGTSLSETSSSGSTSGAEAVEKPCETIQEEPEAAGKSSVEKTPMSVIVQVSMEESSDREGIRLGNVPTTVVERSLYNNYRLLFLIIEPLLLSNDVVKLKEWAMVTFLIDTSQDAAIDIFWKLDRHGVITASNLTLLRGFFEKILRFDLTHLIDCFLSGDYSILHNANLSAFSRNGSGVSNGRSLSRSPQGATGTSKPRREPIPTSDGVNHWFSSGNSEMVEIEEALVVDPPKREASTPNCRPPFPRELVVADRSPAYENDVKSARNCAVNQKELARTTESRVPVERPASSHGKKPSYDTGSNGQKLSKFQRQDSQRNGGGGSRQDSDDDSDDDENEEWLCNHYKRRCHVKFACCDKYWPCHRCHNNESDCGQKKLKSIHTKFVKCIKCDTEQEFSERSQFCINCHTKFAKYFCPFCKHLTGKDDKPYHCGKCGICRIHKHRSFHCDVCGVCLDVQLRDNHKCREGSAHDECCICLEDAFTGCQILPCSHKVHKECATKMIRSGITRCPICRESFAHKLEKRHPDRPQHKHLGKN